MRIIMTVNCLVILVLNLLVMRDGRGHQPLLANEQKPGGTTQNERRPPLMLKVPYPDSVDPRHVVANIQSIARQTTLSESIGIKDFASADLHARRIIQVRSEMPPPGFLVVELTYRANPDPIALVAITRKGVVLAAQDVRGQTVVRPLELSEVARRVTAKRGRAPIRTEYLYANNVAEPGYSIFRPLAVAITEKGAFYFNSQGEVFAEDGSPLLSEIPARDLAGSLPQGVLPLRSLGRW